MEFGFEKRVKMYFKRCLNGVWVRKDSWSLQREFEWSLVASVELKWSLAREFKWSLRFSRNRERELKQSLNRVWAPQSEKLEFTKRVQMEFGISGGGLDPALIWLFALETQPKD